MNYLTIYKHRVSRIRHWASCGENPTLAHFRHLRHFNSLYSPSTLVENPLHIDLFMQNKPNFQKSQMNAHLYNTTDYERKRDWTLSENKPNSNPNKPNLRKAKMNINTTLTKDYRKKDDFVVRINKPNFQNAKNERKLICYRGLQRKR